MENEENENDIIAKQNLLQEEIIDKNKDKNAFIKLCLSKKKNGDDLNNWTLQELKNIVKEFVSVSQPILPPDEKLKENKNLKEKVIECRKLEKSQLNDKKISITVSNPQMISKNEEKHIYDVKTDPFGWNVERNYNQFERLRKIIAKNFPSFFIPPLISVKKDGKNDKDYTLRKMRFMHMFINSLIQNENFKASEILVNFLSTETIGKFELQLREYEARQLSDNVEEYKTLDGKIIISNDEDNEKYFFNSKKYFESRSELFERLNDILKKFDNNINSLIENLKDIENIFSKIQILNSNCIEEKDLIEGYEFFSTFFTVYRKTLIDQKSIFKKYVGDLFKFINGEGKTYCELLQRREELKVRYKKEYDKLKAKKEKLYSKGNISKFELGANEKNIDKDRIIHDKTYAFEHMCQKDSKDLEKLYNQLGYANNMSISELEKINKEDGFQLFIVLKRIKDKLYPTNNEMNQQNDLNNNNNNTDNNTNNLNDQNSNDQIENNEDNKVVNIIIKNVNGTDHEIESHSYETINEIINKYRTITGETTQEIFFIFKGQKLKPDETVEECKIKNGDNIFVIYNN